MVWLGALIGQLPTLVISLAACVAAVVLIKGPGRWLALGGLVAGMVGSLMIVGLGTPNPALRQVVLVLNTLFALVSYGLLAAAVIAGRFWSQQQSQASPYQSPVRPG